MSEITETNPVQTDDNVKEALATAQGTSIYVAATKDEMVAMPELKKGDAVVVTGANNKVYMLMELPASNINNWLLMQSPVDQIVSTEEQLLALDVPVGTVVSVRDFGNEAVMLKATPASDRNNWVDFEAEKDEEPYTPPAELADSQVEGPNGEPIDFGDLNPNEQKVYANLARLNDFFMNNCSRKKIDALTDEEIDGLIDKDIEHVFAGMYNAAKTAGKKITSVYEAKKDFLAYMYDQQIMDIELSKLSKEFTKIQVEFEANRGFKYDLILDIIDEKLKTCDSDKVKIRIQQVRDSFLSSLTFEHFLPKSRTKKKIYHDPNDQDFKKRYDKEKAKFMDILENDRRKYVIHSPRIEEDICQILAKNFPDGEMSKYVEPFLYSIYRDINKDGKMTAIKAVFVIFFLANVNGIMRGMSIDYSGAFIDNMAAFMQQHYIISA